MCYNTNHTERRTMGTRDEYIESLKWRYTAISNEIVELQQMIKDLFSRVEQRQTQLQNLINLLNSEGENIEKSDLAGLQSGAIAETVYKFLIEEGNRHPMHYADITQQIMAQGVLIPGKNPASNLLSNINRDSRFVRTAPGTYGLAEWGIQSTVIKKRKPRKKSK